MKSKISVIILAVASIFCITAASWAASIFTTTIRNCTPEQVTDVLIEVMTGKNFVVNEVTPYKVTFDKNFGDGFWVAAQNTTVRFNLLQRDGNVKLMVTETEKYNDGWSTVERKRAIDQLVPLIQEVRNLIDHTPKDQITNEAVDQLPGSGNKREKKLGIKLTSKGLDGFYRVKTVEPGSFAAESKSVFINDKVLEINGQNLASLEQEAIETYIANKWGAGSSLMFLIEHEGEQKIVTLKKE